VKKFIFRNHISRLVDKDYEMSLLLEQFPNKVKQCARGEEGIFYLVNPIQRQPKII